MTDEAQERIKAAALVAGIQKPGHATIGLVLPHATSPNDLKEMLRTIEKLMLLRVAGGVAIDMTVNVRQRTAEEEKAAK